MRYHLNLIESQRTKSRKRRTRFSNEKFDLLSPITKIDLIKFKLMVPQAKSIRNRSCVLRWWRANPFRSICHPGERAVALMKAGHCQRSDFLACRLLRRGMLDRAIRATKVGRDVGLNGKPRRLLLDQKSLLRDILKIEARTGTSLKMSRVRSEVFFPYIVNNNHYYCQICRRSKLSLPLKTNLCQLRIFLHLGHITSRRQKKRLQLNVRDRWTFPE
jgi:hypothetical protein